MVMNTKSHLKHEYYNMLWLKTWTGIHVVKPDGFNILFKSFSLYNFKSKVLKLFLFYLLSDKYKFTIIQSKNYQLISHQIKFIYIGRPFGLHDILVSAECGMSSMKIRAYRPLNFNGEMFLKQSMFGCKLTEMFTNVPGYKMYELDIPLQAISPCTLKKTENPEVIIHTLNYY